MHDYRKLRVYDQAVDIAASTYAVTKALPAAEKYGLTQQLNRASVSIAANIAEGAARGDRKDFARFLRIARGSAAEVDTLLLISTRLGLVEPGMTAELRDAAETLKAGLTNLERSIKTTT